VPLHGIDDPNLLELCALKALDWNIAIDLGRWNQWMDYITSYHTTVARHRVISREYGVFAGIIDRVKCQDTHWDCRCEGGNSLGGSSRFANERRIYADTLRQSLPIHSQSQPRLHLPPRAHDLPYSSPWLCNTDPVINGPSITGDDAWCPAADPILPNTKPARTMGMAPGMELTVQPITIVDILENIFAGRYALP